jgi:hypothetical protein
VSRSRSRSRVPGCECKISVMKECNRKEVIEWRGGCGAQSVGYEWDRKEVGV